MLRATSATRIYIFSALSTLIVALLIHFFTNSEMDFAMHDAYFVLYKLDFFLVYVLLFLVSAGISFLFSKLKRPLRKALCIVHVLCTLPGIVVIAFYNNSPTSTGNYTDSTVYEEFDRQMEIQYDVNFWMTIFFILAIVGIVVFIVNLSVSTATKIRQN